MKEIKLTQNQTTLVDDKDYNKLNKYKWHAVYYPLAKNYCAKRNVWLKNGKQTTVQMHRIIMDAPRNLQVDHINHNTLDNRKENLRLCTNGQNQMNRINHKDFSSKYKGVDWYKRCKKWRVAIRINNKPIHIGYFNSEIEAGKAYNKKARELFGEFAKLNVIGER